MSFKIKLTLILSTIVFFIVTSVCAIVYKSTIETLSTITGDLLKEPTFNAMDKIDRLLFERQANMQTLAGNSKIISKKTPVKEKTEILLEYKNKYHSYMSLSLYDENGNIIADTNGIKEDSFTSKQTWKEAVYKKKKLSSARDIVYMKDLKSHVIVFAAPILDKNEELTGSVLSKVPANKIINIIKNTFDIQKTSGSIKLDLVKPGRTTFIFKS